MSVVVLGDGHAGTGLHPSRSEILSMPLEQRREVLMRQSQRLAAFYEPDAQRDDLEGGDIVE